MEGSMRTVEGSGVVDAAPAVAAAAIAAEEPAAVEEPGWVGMPTLASGVGRDRVPAYARERINSYRRLDGTIKPLFTEDALVQRYNKDFFIVRNPAYPCLEIWRVHMHRRDHYSLMMRRWNHVTQEPLPIDERIIWEFKRQHPESGISEVEWERAEAEAERKNEQESKAAVQAAMQESGESYFRTVSDPAEMGRRLRPVRPVTVTENLVGGNGRRRIILPR